MKRFLLPVIGSGLLLLLSACGTEDGGPATISTTAPIIAGVNGVEALYAPSSDPAIPSVLPLPNNAALSPDGTTINLKDAYGNPYTDITLPQGAMNTLDGFSTVGAMSTGFGEALDAATIPQAVHVFDALGTKLIANQDYYAFASANVLVIKPLKALKSSMNYLVAVTNNLKGVSGKQTAPSKVFNLMKSPVPLVAGGISQIPGVPASSATALEALRSTVTPVFTVAAAHQILKDDIVVAWSFRTQSIAKVLPAILADAATNPYANSAANFVTFSTPPSLNNKLGTLSGAQFAAANGLPPAAVSNIGSVVIGAIPQMPYYLDAYSAANPLGPIRGRFAFNAGSDLPITKSLEAVPFLLSTPNSVGPWPVAIFQHGFTVDKSVMFGVANTLAKAGYVTIGIDAVLHGDRTFGVDYVNNTTGLPPGGDGPDSSGKYYLNLSSLLTSRDNIRQSVADLIHLTQLLKAQTMDIVNNTTGAPGVDAVADLDVAAPFVYVGHSNGGILGGVLAGVLPTSTISKYVLANPGGDYAEILKNSDAFSPVVNAGLTAKGAPPGSAAYNSFMFAAQTVVDDGDPLNYASLAAAQKIFLLKTTPDGVVPNAQTDALSLNLGLKQVSANGTATWPLGILAPPQAVNAFINYTAGSHSSFLSPTAPFPADAATFFAAYSAMQTDTYTFLSPSFGVISISDIAVTE